MTVLLSFMFGVSNTTFGQKPLIAFTCAVNSLQVIIRGRFRP